MVHYVYAHHRLSHRLHLVPVKDGALVRTRAICGRRSPHGQAWQLPTEAPAERICKRCACILAKHQN